MKQYTTIRFTLDLTKKFTPIFCLLASGSLFAMREWHSPASRPAIKSVPVGATFKNPRFTLPALQNQIPALPAQTISPAEPTLLSSQIIKVKIENHLPEGALIRSIYKEKRKEAPIFVDHIIQLPGNYRIKIPVLRKKDDTLLKFMALQCIDLQSNIIIEEFTQRRLQSEDAPESIFLIRTKKTGREQLPPLETPKNRLKPIRRSPLPISTLIPISEDERDNEILSEITFSTGSPSVSPTFSQSRTSPSLSLNSLPEED